MAVTVMLDGESGDCDSDESFLPGTMEDVGDWYGVVLHVAESR
jgi:hypothetical protein